MSTAHLVYPCDYGTGFPMGYHHYKANEQGVVVCIYCGAHTVKL